MRLQLILMPKVLPGISGMITTTDGNEKESAGDKKQQTMSKVKFYGADLFVSMNFQMV